MEIGVGSGVISGTLLHRFKNSNCIGIDIQQHCIELTQINCNRINVSNRIELYHKSIQQFYNDISFDTELDFIVSNPPYILSDEMKSLSKTVYNYEDHIALDGGMNGLDIINEILSDNIIKYCKPNALIWIEGHHAHPQHFINNGTSNKNISLHNTLNDCFGHPRYMVFQINK